MKVLILHKIGYPKIVYHNGIDHSRHDVVYVGVAEKLKDIPPELRCRKLAREDLGENICESVLTALGNERDFDRIISLSEYELLEAAKVREALNVPGPSYAEARLVRNKVAMKQAITAAGIAAPSFVPLTALDDKLPWAGKTVLKPAHGAGSEDVIIYASTTEALAAIAARKTGIAALDGEGPQLGSYELEEFVSGPIIHIDGLVRDGIVGAAIGSRYVGTCQRYNENTPLGSYQFDLDRAQLNWIQRVTTATRIRTGAFHLEAIESERGVVFLEIGNRTGGAGVPQATSLAWDADFQKLELELIVDDCHTNFAQLRRRGRYYGWYVLPGHCHAQGEWVPTAAVERLKADQRVVTWYERAPSEGYDHRPDYDLSSLPFGGIVGAERSELVRDYIVELFAAVHWRTRGE